MLVFLTDFLSPVIWLMEQVLDFYTLHVSSIGLSIVLLSITLSFLLFPVQKYGRKITDRVSARMHVVNDEVLILKSELKGEELFLATEKVYKKYGYHPIHSIAMSLGILIMLPVLISAIIIFNDNDILTGQSFLFIADLSKPDGLFAPVNVLPIIMILITWIDARVTFRNDKESRYRFYFISIILFVLVYNMPAALVLYWTASNVMSLLLSKA